MKKIRSIFVSDVHLGCRYTHADALLAFIKNHQPEYLYIVGDFIDGWRHAAHLGCSGVICGHIHTPAISERNGVRYFNTGDWVESCTALVEYTDGSFEILYHPLNAPDESLAAVDDAAELVETGSPSRLTAQAGFESVR